MGFLAIFGRLPNAWGTLALIVLSGMVEGFGLVLFVPLLELMTGGSAGNLAPIVETRVSREDACLQPRARRLGIADVDEDGHGDVLCAGCAI